MSEVFGGGVGRQPLHTASLSSWYSPGFSDRLGDRLLLFDNTGSCALEMLRLRAHLTEHPEFEARLRRQIAALRGFTHPSFSPVYSLDTLEGSGGALAIVSAHAAGPRLSEVLARAAVEPQTLPTNTALSIVRQVVRAVAELHSHGDGLAHGALGPERIVVTAQDDALVVEHVLAPALETLAFDERKLWSELRLATCVDGHRRVFGQRTDIMQIGLIAMAAVLRRNLDRSDFPRRIDVLLAEAERTLTAWNAATAPAIVDWLERAVQFAGRRSFNSAIDAAEASDWEESADRRLLLTEAEPTQTFYRDRDLLAWPTEHDTPDRRSNPTQTTADRASTVAENAPRARAAGRTRVSGDPTAAIAAVATTAGAASAVWVREAPMPSPAAQDAETETTVESARTLFGTASGGTAPRGSTIWMIAAAVVTVTIVTAAGIMVGTRAGSEAYATLVIDSKPAGAQVRLDGETIGTTPLRRTVPVGTHSLEVSRDGITQRLSLSPREGAELTQYLEFPSVVAAANVEPSVSASTDVTAAGGATTLGRLATGAIPASAVVDGVPPGRPASANGTLLVSSGVPVEIFRDGVLVGASGSRAVTLPAGRSQLELVNREFDFRAMAVVDVPRGEQASLTLPLPRGTINVNAQPWAEVFIDGTRVGETPLGNVSMPIGPHRVVLQHPELGATTRDAIVKAGVVTLVSVDLRK